MSETETLLTCLAGLTVGTTEGAEGAEAPVPKIKSKSSPPSSGADAGAMAVCIGICVCFGCLEGGNKGVGGRGGSLPVRMRGACILMGFFPFSRGLLPMEGEEDPDLLGTAVTVVGFLGGGGGFRR